MKVIVIVFCVPIYIFFIIGEAYSSSTFTFIGKSATFCSDFASIISGKDLYSNRIEEKQYNRKQMKKNIRYVKNNEFISDEYRTRIISILKGAKRNGYRVYDSYFENQDKSGLFHLSFTKDGLSTGVLTYFVLNPDNEFVEMYKGDSDWGYDDITFEVKKTDKDVIPYLLEHVK